MNKKIYNSIKAKNYSVTINELSTELSIDGIEVLKAVLELREQGYIKQDTPIPLSVNNDSSCRYSVTGKEYLEK